MLQGMLWKQRDFLVLSEAPIKNGQQVNELLSAIRLPSETAVIKIEPEYQGNALANFPAQTAATESLKAVAQVVDFLIQQKITPIAGLFCHPDVLGT